MKSSGWGKGPKGKATRLHSILVRSRGACERCGKAGEIRTESVPGLGALVVPIGGLQCAHIIGRRYSATRTDERNAWALCAGCHMRLGEHPDEHMHLAAQTIGLEAFDELKAKALAGVKSNDVFWRSEVERLTAELEVLA